MNKIELCRQLVSIDSSSLHGTLDMARFVADAAQKIGLESEIHSENVGGVDHANVVVRVKGDHASTQLLLVSKLDTTDPGEYGVWDRTGANPFNLSVNGGELYGLGIADAKADIACKLKALSEFSKTHFSKVSPVFVGTFGQSSGTGAIKLLRKKSVTPFAALVSAPTNLRIASKGPGYARVEITIPFSDQEKKYFSMHNELEATVTQSRIFTPQHRPGVFTDLYDNPIIKLIEYLKNVPNGIAILSIDAGTSADTEPNMATLDIDIVDSIREGVVPKLLHISEGIKSLAAELKTVEDKDFYPQFSTITFGMVRTFPEEIVMQGVCRLIPANRKDVYEPWLEGLRQKCEDVSATFRILDYKPPFSHSLEGALFDILKGVSSEAGLPEQIGAAKNCTEANVFHRLGIETLVFGPGDVTSKTHASQEFVREKDLDVAESMYKQIIESVCK